MRGLTHYLSGLAIATFFKKLTIAVMHGNLLIVVPAAFAYLPDFLDFKFWKFLEKWHFNIDPAPPEPGQNRAPKKVNIADLTEDERYRFYKIEGKASNVKDLGDRVEFYLEDDSGVIKVVAIGEDRDVFLKTAGHPKEGDFVSVSGYMDIQDGEKVFMVADAPHPMYIAERVAKAIDYAYESGEDVRVKIQTIRMVGDIYRRYIVDLDGENQTIRVAMGPLVTVGGNPIEDKGLPEYRRMAEVKTKHPFEKKYPKPTVIEAFSGPSIGFVRRGEKVEEVFLPWHREWSHSFITGAVLAALLYLLATFLGIPFAGELSLASMLGFWAHIIEDQLGYMGGNLFYPLMKKRIPGLMLGESGSPVLNFSTAWLMIGFMIANLNELTPTKPIGMPYPITLLVLSLPSIVLYLYAVTKWLEKKRTEKEIEEKAIEEAFEEEEEEIGGT